MNDVAFFYYDKNIYWHGIIMALAVAALLVCVFALRIMQRGNAKNLGIIAVLALPAALFSSRFTYCFFELESFSDIKGQMLTANGGNSFLGAALGVIAVVLLARIFKLIDNVAELLDCIAPSAALGIGIGRLSAIFSTSDRGMEISGGEGMKIITAYDETGSNKVVAVFFYESVCAVLLFLALLAFFVWIYAMKGKEKEAKSGDVALMFLVGFGTTQGVLESMRTDSLTIVGLRFVRVLQIAALLCILIAAVVFSVRAIKKNKVFWPVLISWVLQLALLGIQIYIEFKITADTQIMLHTIMVECMFGVLLACLWQYSMARGKMILFSKAEKE